MHPDQDALVRIQAVIYDDAAVDDAMVGIESEPEDPVALVRSCLKRQREGRGPEVVLDGHFEFPHLVAQYPDEVLNFLAPDEYDPGKPTGLLVLLHGGGSGTPRDAARNWLIEPEGESGGYHFGRELRAQQCVCVAPSNLLLPTHKRWSNPQSDAYLLAVIEEASFRYSIDPDRVFLAGQSMGGFGAFHTVHSSLSSANGMRASSTAPRSS